MLFLMQRTKLKYGTKTYQRSRKIHFVSLQYTMAEILDIVQASEAEIDTALQKMQAIIINGKYALGQPCYC